ncbi:MAG: hypothetical protein Q9219_004803 [cf. Caloplaca sp. 3 TL-2023]
MSDKPLSEVWWTVNLWGNLIDAGVNHATGAILHRGETSLQAGTKRKAISNQLTHKGSMALGRECDGVLADTEYNETMVIEAAPSSRHDAIGGEFEHDHTKLVRSCCEMLWNLHRKFGTEVVNNAGVEVFSIVTQGAKVILYGVQMKGYTVNLCRYWTHCVPKAKTSFVKMKHILHEFAKLHSLLRSQYSTLENLWPAASRPGRLEATDEPPMKKSKIGRQKSCGNV